MIAAEAYAREHWWCPHANVSWYRPATSAAPETHGLAGNRDAGGLLSSNSNCLGPRCSQWRWYDPPVEYKMTRSRDENEMPDPPPGDGWIFERRDFGGLVGSVLWSRENKNRRGYCGRAGKPEHAD